MPTEGSPELDEFLASIPLFAGLEPAALADLRKAAEPFEFAVGEFMFRQDDAADGVYLVASGEVALKARTPGDGLVELVRIGPGGLIGEFCLLDGGRRSAEALVLEPAAGFQVHLGRFDALRAGERPAALEVLDRLRTEVARRTRATSEALAASLGELAAPRPAPATLAPPGETGTGDCEAQLATFSGFDGFSQASWRELETLATKTTAPRGTRLEAPGRPVTGLHIVARGALRAGLPVDGGVEQLLIHGPGSLAGAAALLDGGEWPLALDVREDAIVYTLDAGDFAALRTSNSPLMFRLLDMLGQQLARDLRRISRVCSRRESQLADLGESS
jgi:CRP-like cAMP-binding protein